MKRMFLKACNLFRSRIPSELVYVVVLLPVIVWMTVEAIWMLRKHSWTTADLPHFSMVCLMIVTCIGFVTLSIWQWHAGPNVSPALKTARRVFIGACGILVLCYVTFWLLLGLGILGQS